MQLTLIGFTWYCNSYVKVSSKHSDDNNNKNNNNCNNNNPDNFKSWRSCSYQSYQKPGRHYVSLQLSELATQLSELPKLCQQWELTFLLTIAFRANKIPTTLRADVYFSMTVRPPHSELHYSPSLHYVGPKNCEKCRFARFRIFLSSVSATFLPL